MKWAEAGVPIPASADDPDATLPEDELSPGQKPSIVAHKTGTPPSRLSLRLSAGWWRSLQRIGMSLHFWARPWPPNPDFSRAIPSTLSKNGTFALQFYLPDEYKKSATASDRENQKYPAVINFHGGGFTLGAATDDARFARYVLDICGAVFVSVDYRLAPEFPFPTAVEDGADALLYIIRNADELRIDPFRLATLGFSAGANIAFTAAMKLSEIEAKNCLPPYRIRAVASWYPITDFTLTRAERRATAVRPDHTIPPVLTKLFDASYLYPPDIDLAHPYLSPSKASDEELLCGVPNSVILYGCEWDMLLREGEGFAKRLGNPSLGKNVYFKMISGVPHAWDKGPNPMAPAMQTNELYTECCMRLRDVLSKDPLQM